MERYDPRPPPLRTIVYSDKKKSNIVVQYYCVKKDRFVFTIVSELKKCIKTKKKNSFYF